MLIKRDSRPVLGNHVTCDRTPLSVGILDASGARVGSNQIGDICASTTEKGQPRLRQTIGVANYRA